MSVIGVPADGGTAAVAPRCSWRVRSARVPRTPKELIEILLELRGVPPRDAEGFLSPPYETSLHDPLLLPQCGAAVARMRRALRSAEPIAVFGDYDVDGITGAALVADVLTRLGGLVRVELPHREEGYGLSVEAARRLVPPSRLLITVDNGTSAQAAVAEAVARGADVLILDHHTVNGALPPGALVVNPALPSSRYPNPSLAAVGVAWKVLSVLLAEEGHAGEEKFLLDLVCLGTLADSMQLRGENRALVSWGLEVLRHSRRPGLQVLAEQAGISPRDLTAEAVTFKLIPRLNAAGRLRHADLALDLVRTPDVGNARRLARELDAVNLERRTLTEDILKDVTRSLPVELPSVLWVQGPWPPGILGILASRLAEQYQRPAVAVALRDNECIASIRGPSSGSGSPRPLDKLGVTPSSVEERAGSRGGNGTNVVEMVRRTEALLSRFGGHAGAAGFTFPRAALDAVAEFFHAHPSLPTASDQPELVLDCPLPLQAITPELARALQHLEPYGNGNHRPIFLLPGVSMVESRVIGSDGSHRRFVFRTDGAAVGTSAVAFRWGERPQPAAGALLDVAAEVRFDQFRGVPRADLHVQDLRSAQVMPLPSVVSVPVPATGYPFDATQGTPSTVEG